MANEQIPLVGALNLAAQIQTYLAASKLRLFTAGFTPGPNDTITDLAGVEATYSGYTAGGIALTAWLAPALDPVGGSSISSPQVQFAYVPPMSSPVSNSIGGWFLVDSTGALVADGLFDNPLPMGVAGDAIPISIKLWLGTLAAIVGATVFGGAQ
jgi:hypothetical protein